MAVTITNPDYFQLTLNNGVGTAYNKNGVRQMGRLPRDGANLFCEECLLRPDLTGVSGTINSVLIRYNIDNASGLDPVGLNQVLVYEENKGGWADNGATEPIFDTFVNSAWSSQIATGPTMVTSDTGIKTIQSTALMVALFQDWVDAVKVNDGVIMTIPFGSFAFTLAYDDIEIEVDFTPSATQRRKLIIID